jgi:hypothetical protein
LERPGNLREHTKGRAKDVAIAHRRAFVGTALSILLFAAVACQSPSARVTSPTATAIPAPAAVAATSDSGSSDIVWGKVPYCTCLSGISTANVSTALKDAHLAGTVKEHYPTGGWMYFVVTFDPKGTSREQISAAITAGGGTVVDGPP